MLVTQSCQTLCSPMDCSTPDFLSITNSWSLLNLMSIESMMPSNHLILFHCLLLPPSIFSSIRDFSNELVLRIQLAGRFWVFLLSHTAPGFQLCFFFHLCMWLVHRGFLLRLPWRTWVCPREGQVWRWCSCLGCMDSGSTRYSGELRAREAGYILI